VKGGVETGGCKMGEHPLHGTDLGAKRVETGIKTPLFDL